MPVDDAFAPYRMKPGALAEEASRRAALVGAEPLLAAIDEPLPAGMANRAFADIPAGRAGGPEEACRAADGGLSGISGPPRACLSSPRQRDRVAEAISRALAAGFAGVCLDRPDAPLALGLLGAGFCAECQRAFARELTREYGEHFQPLDYLALARQALAQARGAVGFEQLPFGRDFWRMRNLALPRAVGAYARAARDAARDKPQPLVLTAHFEALGPAQIAAARHLDAAIFPAALPDKATGAGLFRLLRGAMGRRPCAAALAPSTPESALPRLAAVAAACGVELSGAEPAGEQAARLAAVRRFGRALAAHRDAPSASAIAECAILYSAESDLWTGGAHREEVIRAGEALAAIHVQAPVVLRPGDVPASTPLVLAAAEALSPLEAGEIARRVESGGGVLVLGTLGAVDDAGGRAEPPLPAGKPAGLKFGEGTIAALPALAPAQGGAFPAPPAALDALSRSIGALVGKGRRAVSLVSRTPLLALAYKNEEWLDIHLVTLGPTPAQGTTLFIGVHVTGGARKARFQSAAGRDEKIVMNPAGYSISTVLPAFEGYAVLSLAA